MKNNKKRRKLTKKDIISLVLIVIFSCIFIYALWNLCSILITYKIDNDYNEALQEKYVVFESDTEDSTEENTEENNNDVATNTSGSTPVVDFAALKNVNSDVIGWLYSKGTVISYPVVSTTDNNYYLRKGIDGSYLSSGTLFSDENNGAVGTDKNLIIYGHHVKSGIMFASLCNYKNQSYYEQHKEMLLLTPEKNYKIEIFAGKIISGDDSSYYKINFSSNDAFLEFVEKVRNGSTFTSDVTVEAGDHIITFSTCSYEFNNARYVLYGKLAEA